MVERIINIDFVSILDWIQLICLLGIVILVGLAFLACVLGELIRDDSKNN